MFRIRALSKLALLFTPFLAIAHPTQPLVTGSVQLGSERLWTRIDSTFTVKTSASIARKKRVTVVAIDSEGRAWRNDSAEYTKPWASTPGCATEAECRSTYTASGKRTTDWMGWSQILSDARFDWSVKPEFVRDEAGRSQLFLSQTTPERRLVVYVIDDNGSTPLKSNVSPILTQPITSISATLLGGRDLVSKTATLVSVHIASSTFRIFERSGTANFTEHRVAPSGSFQFSEHPPKFQSHGLGNFYGTFFYFTGGSWNAIAFEHGLDSLPRSFESRALSNWTGQIAPSVLWQPGNYAHGVFVKDNKLHTNIGLFNKQNFGLPAVSQSLSDVPVRMIKVFNHNSDAFVVSNHTDGTTKLFRYNTEATRGGFEFLGELNLSAASDLRSLDVAALGTEVYLSATINTGRVVWVNLIRAAADLMSRKYYLQHYAPPTMEIPYDAMLAFSNFGQAFWSVPLAYHALYTSQPDSRCHPLGFSPPIVCGKVFFEWNDYWGVPSSPGVWQTRADAINAIADTDPSTEWPLGWLKAFVGSVVLKSNINDTQSIFHELMHEFDFDGINGSLVEGASDFATDFARIFNDRSPGRIPTRNTGFVSGYAQSNAREDWADTASFYRFQGAWFRYLASVDTLLGDSRLQQKYDFVKRVFRNKEYSNFGTMSFGSDVLVPLVQFRHPDRTDFVSVASVHETQVRLRDGYIIRGLDSWGFSRQLEGTAPLKLMAGERGNLSPIVTDSGASILRSIGFYVTPTILGYVYSSWKPGTRELRLYYKNTSTGRDATLASDPNMRRFLIDSRYTEGPVQGYVLESAVY